MAQSSFDISKIFMGILIAIIIGLSVYIMVINHRANSKMEAIETVQTQDKKYTQYYYEREFEALKKENRELYDSLKTQQKNISSVVQYKYKIEYQTDTVFVEQKQELPQAVQDLPDETYVYNEETDSLNYTLQVNSKTEPNWYLLNVGVNDKFTIVSKEFADGRQTTTIESERLGEIEDITAWQKPRKTKWYQRFKFGPTVTAGYDPINKNFGVMVGFGCTYNIFGN